MRTTHRALVLPATASLILLALTACSADAVPPADATGTGTTEASQPAAEAPQPAAGCSEEYFDNPGEAQADALPAAVAVPSLPQPPCLKVTSHVGNGMPEYLASSSGTWEIYQGLFPIDGSEAIDALLAYGYVVAANDSSYFTAPATAWDPFFAGSPADSVTVGAVQAHTDGEPIIDTAVEFYGLPAGNYVEIEFQVKVAG